MRTIWKYPIPVGDSFELELPRGAIVRHIGGQEEGPVMWVEVPDTDETLHLRRFFLARTGHPIPGDRSAAASPYADSFRYLGTFQHHESQFTGPTNGHVFEIVSEV